MNRFVLQRRYWVLAPLVWGVVILMLHAWNQHVQDDKTLALARERAHFVARLVEATRMWAARHGGVYAPTTEDNPPNPWLAEDSRQIRTEQGVDLTLINPSYMTRQLGSVIGEYNDLHMRLTSLQPVNPANAPGPWEREQLLRFVEQKLPMVEQLEVSGDDPQYRYIKPLYLSKPCQQCHQRPDDLEGSLRGGISLSFPVTPLLQANQQYMWVIGWISALVWLLLSGLTVLVMHRIRSQIHWLEVTQAMTEQQVRERTRELAQKALEHQQAAAQLKLFIDSAGEGIIALDLQGRCTLANPRALQLLGFEQETQLLGMDLHEQIHRGATDAHSAADCLVHATLNSGEQIHQEDDLFWRADGCSLPVEYHSYPLHADGKLIGAVISFSDISQRKQRQLQLEKISNAMEHSASTAVITNDQGIIEYVNPHFVKTTGYSREEAIGQNPRILQSGATPPELYQQLWKTLQSGRNWVGELLNRKKDGTLYWEYVRISPIKTDSGEITHFVAIKEDITERKQREQHIWRQAHTDPLTGLANRVYMQQQLEQALLHAQTERQGLALLYIDLDGFKAINDTHGHGVGDLVLIEVAHRLKQAVRSSDIVARLGGDEFVVILPHINDQAGAGQLANKLVALLEQVYMLEGNSYTGIAASVGMALFPHTANSADSLLEQADQAMYRAKQQGGSRWCVLAEFES